MPVYRVLFRLKFSSVSGHMIKCLLTEFGRASAENIWLGVMKERPRCARSVGHDPEPSIFFRPALLLNQQEHSISVLYDTSITNDVMEHEK